MTSDNKVSVSQNAVARSLSGETVLLHLEQGTYFGLNEVGGFLWEIVENEPSTLEELTEQLCAQFDVEEDQARSDVLALATALVENDLWVKVDTD